MNADLFSDSDFKKLIGKSYSLQHNKFTVKQKPGLNISCPDCGKYFRFKWQLNEHSRIHENKVHFKCHNCPSTFIRVGDLNKHLVVHSNEKPFKCSFCAKHFKSKQTRVCHEDTHDLNIYTCRICDKSFKRYHLKIKHERTHRQSEILKGDNGELKYKCIFCNGIFASMEFLNEHILKNHKRKTPAKTQAKFKQKFYKCLVCSEKFKTYKEHKSHIESKHPNEFENIFKENCKICHKNVSASFLSYHIMAHKGMKPHICKQCDASFARKGELNKHKLVHNEFKTYQCSYCKVIKKNRQDMEKHKLQHFGMKRFKCDECDAAYPTSSNLQQHKRRWHMRNFETCNVCQKKVLNIDLNRHMKINHEKNEKLCDHCGITFLNSSKLKKHFTHLQKKIKFENSNKVSHPYFRYEGSSELPFSNRCLKIKNNWNIDKSCSIFNYNNLNGSNAKIGLLQKKRLFIGECVICGFTSISRLRLISHLQNKKFQLRFWRIKDENKLKVGAPASQIQSSTFDRIFHSPYSYTESVTQIEIVKNINGTILSIKPTKEITCIDSLFSCSKRSHSKKTTISSFKIKKVDDSNLTYLPVPAYISTVNPFNDNHIASAISDMKSYCCQICSMISTIPTINNCNDDTIIFRCTYCGTFNKDKIYVKLPDVKERNLYSSVNSLTSELITEEKMPRSICLVNPIVSWSVLNSTLSTQSNEKLSPNSSSLLKAKTNELDTKTNVRKLLKAKTNELDTKTNVRKLLKADKMEHINRTVKKIPSLAKLNQNKDNLEVTLSENKALLHSYVSYKIDQNSSIEKELAAIKGKCVLSIDELKRLRGTDVDTLLKYLQQ